MRGVILKGNGGYEMLEYREDLPDPEPGPEEVLIKVAAAGVNNTDINTRIGWYSKNNHSEDDAGWNGKPLSFPRIQGADGCGQIVATGLGVDPKRRGERVIVEPSMRLLQSDGSYSHEYLGSEREGSFAEYLSVPSRYAHPIRSTLLDIELASFPCSYSTAENCLIRAEVSSSDRVLVTGASGGVGSAAVQLAKARGAYVIAVAGKEKADALYSVGADLVIPRRESIKGSLSENSISVAVDLVGGDRWPEILEILRPGGRYAVSGAIAGAMVSLDLRTLYLKDLTFFGCTSLEDQIFPNLIRRIESGEVKPLIARVFALEDIVEAQQFFLEKRHVGKIVLEL